MWKNCVKERTKGKILQKIAGVRKQKEKEDKITKKNKEEKNRKGE